jgi:predicted regulator of Ras-like GTPase activity (Roadblock/LC7/MglB family)
MQEEPVASDPITDELLLIRKNVPGIRGSITATSDGLLLAHDIPGLEPTQIAALVAATHAVAVRASLSTECGQLKEVITRGSDGYLAVYGAGGTAIVAVLGTTELNVAMLNFHARKTIERIVEYSADLTRKAGADLARKAGSPADLARQQAGSAAAKQERATRQGRASGGQAAGSLPARRRP